MKPEERFWRKVFKVEGGCWLWLASVRGKGYGSFWDGQRNVYAHRYAYELIKGPIPEDCELHHAVCETKLCVNPNHAEPVGHLEHSKISSAGLLEKTHCPLGHPYAGGNLYINPCDGYRLCLQCRTDRNRTRIWIKGKGYFYTGITEHEIAQGKAN